MPSNPWYKQLMVCFSHVYALSHCLLFSLRAIVILIGLHCIIGAVSEASNWCAQCCSYLVYCRILLNIYTLTVEVCLYCIWCGALCFVPYGPKQYPAEELCLSLMAIWCHNAAGDGKCAWGHLSRLWWVVWVDHKTIDAVQLLFDCSGDSVSKMLCET